MSKKSAKIQQLIAKCHGTALDPHYLGYFECFNQGLFYESHDVLEELWLAQRRQPNDLFYKGLIQFAGAFVHLQKHTEQRPRLKPSAALFNLAKNNLRQYPATHEHLDVAALLKIIDQWLVKLDTHRFLRNPLQFEAPPRLALNVVNPRN